MMSNIKIQRAGQGIPNLRIRMYAAADLERYTDCEAMFGNHTSAAIE